MMDLETWKQRRKEMLREAEKERLIKGLREARKLRGASFVASLTWEARRIAGRLRKHLRSWRKPAGE
jgi:hypothetical protein